MLQLPTPRFIAGIAALGLFLGGVGFVHASAQSMLRNVAFDTKYENGPRQSRSDTWLLAAGHDPICSWLYERADAEHMADSGITTAALQEGDVRQVFVDAFASEQDADHVIAKLTDMMSDENAQQQPVYRVDGICSAHGTVLLAGILPQGLAQTEGYSSMLAPYIQIVEVDVREGGLVDLKYFAPIAPYAAATAPFDNDYPFATHGYDVWYSPTLERFMVITGYSDPASSYVEGWKFHALDQKTRAADLIESCAIWVDHTQTCDREYLPEQW